jgi:hypothetical protein
MIEESPASHRFAVASSEHEQRAAVLAEHGER